MRFLDSDEVIAHVALYIEVELQFSGFTSEGSMARMLELGMAVQSVGSNSQERHDHWGSGSEGLSTCDGD